MRINKLYIAIGLMFAFGLFFELAAHADEGNQETKVTFSAPVQIPGQVLPAGTYTFELAAPETDLSMVRILNADGTHLYATLQTISAESMSPVGETTITLAEQGADKPDLLVKWFYPGNDIGHEFIYPKQQQQEIAHASQETFVGHQLMAGGFAGSN